jgi:cell division protease FtsH
VLARRTPGFTGADLENLLNEAALLAARRNKKKIEMTELEEAVTRVIAGPEKKSRVMTERERKLVAYHEAGHAVVAQLLPNVDPVHEVSIVPRGRAGGYTMILPKEDRFFRGKNELLDQVTHLLGGRASEELVLQEISTGAQNDLERATTLARKMVMEFGMSENIGPMTLGHRQEEVFLGRDLAHGRNYSEEVAASIDKEVRNIIDKCYDRAKNILSENINKLHNVAQALLEREKLNKIEFQEVFAEA